MVALTTDHTTMFSCASGALQPHKKERTVQTVLAYFVELEKKGTAGGRSASERGEEPRSGTLSTSPLFSCFRLPPAHKKRPPFCGLSLWSWAKHHPPFPIKLIILFVSNLCFLTGLRF